jgi:hypothetical protein
VTYVFEVKHKSCTTTSCTSAINEHQGQRGTEKSQRTHFKNMCTPKIVVPFLFVLFTSVEFLYLYRVRQANFLFYMNIRERLISAVTVLAAGGLTFHISCRQISFLTTPHLGQIVDSFPLRQSGFNPRSNHVGFVVDKVALGQIFSAYFTFL